MEQSQGEKTHGLRRRQEILRKLEEQGEVEVQALASEFDVSPMTIRRDLQLFAKQGIAETHYGGAHLCQPKAVLPSFSTRTEQLLCHKMAIGAKAASFLKEGDVIFLDSSTTVIQMLRYFPDIHATVITNSIKAVPQLCTNRKIKLIIAPGEYQEQIGGCLDYHTIEYLQKFHADKAFVGVGAASLDFGVSTPNELDGALKKTFIEQADETFMLADHTKFEQKSLIKYGELKDFQYILTDKELEEKIRERIVRQNRNLILC